MFIDTRQLEDGAIIATEVCIVGGGVAGITIARELANAGIEACVLESGGFKPDDATRELYRGESTGLPYKFADGCRSRFLGGSSNCWGGWCRPMDEQDFAEREWVPYSGWPFGKSELEPYYERSHAVLELGPHNFDSGFWVDAIGRSDVRKIPFSTDRVTDAISQFSPPSRFGRLYRNELERSQRIRVYLHANVIDIETDHTGQTVRGVKVATLNGRTIYVSAKRFVLATGGIENARLLLVSNKVHPAGLGNGADVVGRFFMDHPRIYSAQVRFSEAWSRNKLYDIKYNYQNGVVSAHGVSVGAQFLLSPEAQEQERLLNAHVWFASMFPGDGTETAEALIRMKHTLEKKEQPGRSFGRDMLTLMAHPLDALGFVAGRYLQPRSLIKEVKLQAIVEPAPDPDSRVTLSEERDSLGMNRVRVDWRLGSLVQRTFDRNFAILAEELERAGVAQVSLDPAIEGGEWPDSLHDEGTWHHMGTTRMHDSPKLGVVDRNCRVHGLSNLYIAGSSTFPTAGANFPTITVVALALRLSKHIAEESRRPEARIAEQVVA